MITEKNVYNKIQIENLHEYYNSIQIILNTTEAPSWNVIIIPRGN